MTRWRKFALIAALCAVPVTAWAESQLASDSCGCSFGNPCKCAGACSCGSRKL